MLGGLPVRRYAIHEIFRTLQGEGSFAGVPAVFVRFTGCNVWSGEAEHRARDTAKGVCAAWCDTEFRGVGGARGGHYTAEELARAVLEVWSGPGSPTVVCTGGEPALQLDRDLERALHGAGARIHVETNGSRLLPLELDWVTLSPKPPMPVIQQHYDEVKVIYPAGIDPLSFGHLASLRYLQPLDNLQRKENTVRCVDFVLANAGWRLSVQTHKDIGLP